MPILRDMGHQRPRAHVASPLLLGLHDRQGGPCAIHSRVATRSAVLTHRLMVRRESDGMWVMKVIGIVLVVLGLLGLVYGGVSWTRKDKVLDAGPIELTADKTERLPISPIAGGIVLVVGAAILIAKR